MPRISRAEALNRLGQAPSGHLATVRPDGSPHLVVVTFALEGNHVVTAVDHKPKSTAKLQRLANIEANPAVSFLADEYHNDWTRLWWVRVDGTGSIHHSGHAFDDAVAKLTERYRQYRGRPPEGPVISVSIDRISGWESTR